MPGSDDKSVVITGLGSISPLGAGVGALVDGLRHGRAGVVPLPFSHAGMASSCAALVPAGAFEPGAEVGVVEAERLPRVVPMALAAAREAMAMARLQGLTPGESEDVALALGTGGGGIDFTLAQAQSAFAGQRPSLWSVTNATHGNLAGELSIRLGLRNASWCISTGCASASDAAGLALETLRSDRPGAPRAVVVVGADAHVRWEVLVGMELLRVISTVPCAGDADRAGEACKPFDARRDGFVLGEGAWAMVLERSDAARARGARGLARLAGYGATCDAFHRVRPDPDMAQCARAMRLAMHDAGWSDGLVDVLHYHGTGTRLNDELETRAVRSVLGAHAQRVVGHSVKGAMGHPQGASGMMALVSTLACLRGLDGGPAFSPATRNLRTPDPACNLDYTPNTPRAWPAHDEPTRVLINCLAFGAKNSVLALEVPRTG